MITLIKKSSHEINGDGDEVFLLIKFLFGFHLFTFRGYHCKTCTILKSMR